jgi:hypothetical protein
MILRFSEKKLHSLQVTFESVSMFSESVREDVREVVKEEIEDSSMASILQLL